jgi:hypothetical protein
MTEFDLCRGRLLLLSIDTDTDTDTDIDIDIDIDIDAAPVSGWLFGWRNGSVILKFSVFPFPFVRRFMCT